MKKTITSAEELVLENNTTEAKFANLLTDLSNISDSSGMDVPPVSL